MRLRLRSPLSRGSGKRSVCYTGLICGCGGLGFCVTDIRSHRILDHSGDITRILQKDRPTETALQSKANTHNTQGNCVARQQSMAGHCDLAIISFGSSHSSAESELRLAGVYRSTGALKSAVYTNRALSALCVHPGTCTRRLAPCVYIPVHAQGA